MIQSTIKNEEIKPVNEWPKLMVADDGDIVLFSKVSCGILLRNGGKNPYEVGSYVEGWVMGCFKPFTGTIELRNE